MQLNQGANRSLYWFFLGCELNIGGCFCASGKYISNISVGYFKVASALSH